MSCQGDGSIVKEQQKTWEMLSTENDAFQVACEEEVIWKASWRKRYMNWVFKNKKNIFKKRLKWHRYVYTYVQ